MPMTGRCALRSSTRNAAPRRAAAHRRDPYSLLAGHAARRCAVAHAGGRADLPRRAAARVHRHRPGQRRRDGRDRGGERHRRRQPVDPRSGQARQVLLVLRRQPRDRRVDLRPRPGAFRARPALCGNPRLSHRSGRRHHAQPGTARQPARPGTARHDARHHQPGDEESQGSGAGAVHRGARSAHHHQPPGWRQGAAAGGPHVGTRDSPPRRRLPEPVHEVLVVL